MASCLMLWHSDSLVTLGGAGGVLCCPPPPLTRLWLRRRVLAGLGVSAGGCGARLDRERWWRFESRRPPPPPPVLLVVLVDSTAAPADEVEEGGWGKEFWPDWIWVLLRVRLSFTPGLEKRFCAAEGGRNNSRAF